LHAAVERQTHVTSCCTRQPITIPQAKTSNRLPGLLRDRNGFPASICLVPRPGPPSSISPPPATQRFRFSTFGLFGERSNSRQALRNLPIHYREQVAERASSQLRIGICARAQSSQQLVPDLISLPCFASPTTRSFSYPRSPTQLALIIKALTTSSCFFNVIELLLSLVSRFTPIPIPHSRLPHPHYHLNPQPPCTPDSTSTLILCSTATQRHHGSSRRRPPFRQPQLLSL
jgi:hypothetical protein